MREIQIDNLTEMGRLFLNTRDVEFSLRHDRLSSYVLHASWDFELDPLEMMRSEKDAVRNVADVFQNLFKPLADMMKISQTPVIEKLEKELEEAKEHAKQLSKEIASLKEEQRVTIERWEAFKQGVETAR